jgi:hypothetical protein
MKLRSLILVAGFTALAISVPAQTPRPTQTPATVSAAVRAEVVIPLPNPAITNTTSAIDLARAALAAHGGEKFRQLRTLLMTGTADLSMQQSPQVLPARFAMTYKGDRTRLDLKSPMMDIFAISDGTRSYSSFKGFAVPSLNKFSTRVLARYDQPGYVVSELPNKKKWRGFRITDPDGDATDFYMDPTTGRVMSYEFTYMGAHSVVEHDKFRIVDGVLIPERFAQRFETSNMGAVYADFKVREIQVNLEIADDVFAIPEQ